MLKNISKSLFLSTVLIFAISNSNFDLRELEKELENVKFTDETLNTSRVMGIIICLKALSPEKEISQDIHHMVAKFIKIQRLTKKTGLFSTGATLALLIPFIIENRKETLEIYEKNAPAKNSTSSIYSSNFR